MKQPWVFMCSPSRSPLPPPSPPAPFSDGRVCLQRGRTGFDLWVGKIPWRKKWQPTPVLLPGKFHGRRSLVGYRPWGRKESDTTERLHFHFTFISSVYFSFSSISIHVKLQECISGGSKEFQFFMIQHRENSVRGKVIGKK